MKRIIEIEDTLDETVEQAISELKECILEWIEENPENGEICLSNDIDYDGRFHQIVDSNTPIYTKEIDDLWYLYKYDFIEAFENAGFDGDSTQNNGMTAIYLYIEQQCWEWWWSIEQDLNNVMDSLNIDYKCDAEDMCDIGGVTNYVNENMNDNENWSK